MKYDEIIQLYIKFYKTIISNKNSKSLDIFY